MSSSATKGRGRSSIIASTTQVVVGGAAYFIVFRYLYDLLGIDQIGIWSLVLATTSLSRIGELGLSAGVVRYVADAIARGDDERAASIVQTTCLALALLMGVLLLALYPLCIRFVGLLVPPEHVALAVAIIPYALLSLWISVAGGVFSGALDGTHRIDLRCYAMAASNLVFLSLVLWLAPRKGLEGVAQAQVWQSTFLALTSWLLLRRQLRRLPLLPWRWRGSLLREMLGYGLNFQAISLMNLLFEPVAKALLGRFGGLAALGHFEMANKLLLQGRSVIVEAGRILVPSVAAMAPGDGNALRELFLTSHRLTFFVSVLFYGLLGIGLTSISYLWLGHYEPEFVLFALLLTAGWFINTLIGPAYFSNLGSGRLRSNVMSHAIMGVVASTGGWLLGRELGGMGVVIGTVLGLAGGSLYLLIEFLARSGFTWSRELIPAGLVPLLLAAIVLVALSFLYARYEIRLLPILAAAAAASAVLLVLAWLNPLRRQLLLKGA